jgi:GGDEF domain-containing protein
MRVATALVPLILSLLAMMGAVWGHRLSAATMSTLQAIPPLSLVAALTMGILFRQSRIFFVGILMIVFGLIAPAIPSVQNPVLCIGACIVVPVVAVVLYHLPERGIFTAYGAKRFAAMFCAMFAAVLAAMIPGAGDMVRGTSEFLSGSSPYLLHVPAFGWVVLGGAIPLLLFRKEKECAALGPLIAFSLALFLPATSGYGLRWFFLDAASLTLVWAVTVHAWWHANIDELTELPGRRFLAHEMSCLRDPFAMAIADLDHFKRINDTYGHDVGDQVLRFLATWIRKNNAGSAYRYGGEEFVIISRQADFKNFVGALEELRVAVTRKQFVLRDPERPDGERGNKKRGQSDTLGDILRLTISIGAARSGTRAITPAAVLEAADKALYQAKSEGRNRVCVAR